MVQLYNRNEYILMKSYVGIILCIQNKIPGPIFNVFSMTLAFWLSVFKSNEWIFLIFYVGRTWPGEVGVTIREIDLVHILDMIHKNLEFFAMEGNNRVREICCSTSETIFLSASPSEIRTSRDHFFRGGGGGGVPPDFHH